MQCLPIFLVLIGNWPSIFWTVREDFKDSKTEKCLFLFKWFYSFLLYIIHQSDIWRQIHYTPWQNALYIYNAKLLSKIQSIILERRCIISARQVLFLLRRVHWSWKYVVKLMVRELKMKSEWFAYCSVAFEAYYPHLAEDVPAGGLD